MNTNTTLWKQLNNQQSEQIVGGKIISKAISTENTIPISEDPFDLSFYQGVPNANAGWRLGGGFAVGDSDNDGFFDRTTIVLSKETG